MGLKNVYKTANHHYGSAIKLKILFPYGFVYSNGPTNVRKIGEGVSVLCCTPYLRLGRGRGVTHET